MSDIAPRELVPTPRQLAGGLAPTTYDFIPTEARATGKKVWGSLAAFDPRKISGPKIPLLVFATLAIFGQVDDFLFTVIGPELRAEFASAPATLGIMATALSVVEYLSMPLIGWLADRIKRVYLVRLAHIGGNLISALSAFAAHPFGFIGIRGGAGLVGLSGQVPQATLLADYYEEESLGRVITFVPAVYNFAKIAAPLLGGILVSATNWRVGVFVLGGIATLAGLTTFFLREPERGEAERRAIGAPRVEAEPLSFGESWRAAKSIHTLRRIWYATPFLVASTAGTFVVVGLYFADVFGLTPAQRGAVATLGAAAGVIGLITAGPIAGRLLARSPGRVMAMIGGVMAFQAVGWAILGVSNVLALSVIGIVPLGLGVAVIVPLQQMVTLKVVPPRIRGLGYSTIAPWTIVGIGVFYLALISSPTSIRGTVIAMIPIQLIGAFLFASGAGTVLRDIRAARASVLAEEAVREAKESGLAKLLVLRGVEVSYEGTQVLFGVDLDLDDGEILALLGTNGAGKSTLLRAIAGVHTASNGAILLDGGDITHEPPHAIASRGVVMMPGGRATFPTLTVEENLRAATWLYRDDEDYIRRRMSEVFDFFPVLRERLGQSAGDLSGGEQQMVGLGQAFLMRPRLLMIDELSLGLAPAVVEKLLVILRAIHQQGTAIILVEQSVNVALTIAKRAVFMEKGDIRFDGETEELLRRPGLIRSVFIGGAVSAKSATTRRAGRIESQEPGRRGLEVQEVTVAFGGVQALQEVSLAVSPGEIAGVIGPNGAGKTTLFDVISGFTPPDSGRIMFDGRDVTAMSPDARARLGIGRSFQNARLFPALTVRENIAAALERRTVKNEVMAALWLPQVRASEVKIFQRVDGLIEILGLEAFADKFASELSTGSRRAVEVACVMAAEPQVLLLDEPSSGLAQAETEELGPVLTRLVRETGCGLLMIEHDIPLITSISQRLVAMDLGRVISTGSPEEVVNDSAVLASYLGQTSQTEN